MDNPDYLSVRDVSVRMKVCKMTVYRLIHAGELDAVRVGKQFRISPENLTSYLNRVKDDDSRDGTGRAAP